MADFALFVCSFVICMPIANSTIGFKHKTIVKWRMKRRKKCMKNKTIYVDSNRQWIIGESSRFPTKNRLLSLGLRFYCKQIYLTSLFRVRPFASSNSKIDQAKSGLNFFIPIFPVFKLRSRFVIIRTICYCCEQREYSGWQKKQSERWIKIEKERVRKQKRKKIIQRLFFACNRTKRNKMIRWWCSKFDFFFRLTLNNFILK